MRIRIEGREVFRKLTHREEWCGSLTVTGMFSPSSDCPQYVQNYFLKKGYCVKKNN